MSACNSFPPCLDVERKHARSRWSQNLSPDAIGAYARKIPSRTCMTGEGEGERGRAKNTPSPRIPNALETHLCILLLRMWRRKKGGEITCSHGWCGTHHAIQRTYVTDIKLALYSLIFVITRLSPLMSLLRRSERIRKEEVSFSPDGRRQTMMDRPQTAKIEI